LFELTWNDLGLEVKLSDVSILATSVPEQLPFLTETVLEPQFELEYVILAVTEEGQDVTKLGSNVNEFKANWHTAPFTTS